MATSTRPAPAAGERRRRRIWGCCQPVASLYKKATGPVEPAEPADSEEAKAILSFRDISEYRALGVA